MRRTAKARTARQCPNIAVWIALSAALMELLSCSRKEV